MHRLDNCSYDIIVSDFGRDAALRLISKISELERKHIQKQLPPRGRAFLDEDRRINFVLLGQLRHFKRELLPSVVLSSSKPEDILLGLLESEEGVVPSSVRKRIVQSIASQARWATSEGFRTIRVVIPCNTLSPLANDIEKIKFSGVARIAIYTVPRIVLERLTSAARVGFHRHVLLLGTPAVFDLYRQEARKIGCAERFTFLSPGKSSQRLLNRALCAAIQGSRDVELELAHRLRETLVRPMRQRWPDLVVVEACTDFRLGLGLNSNTEFARRLVSDLFL